MKEAFLAGIFSLIVAVVSIAGVILSSNKRRNIEKIRSNVKLLSDQLKSFKKLEDEYASEINNLRPKKHLKTDKIKREFRTKVVRNNGCVYPYYVDDQIVAKTNAINNDLDKIANLEPFSKGFIWSILFRGFVILYILWEILHFRLLSISQKWTVWTSESLPFQKGWWKPEVYDLYDFTAYSLLPLLFLIFVMLIVRLADTIIKERKSR